ncbi:MAG: segregation/condensation protein A [Lachnospiraceae bacterium]|nr:segregation/condensation protein A [Lachnospiraceae bacterium]
MAIPVKLEVFEGPLDLLLHLIEKNKVDIYDIPISLITEQYLEYVQNMPKEDLNVVSEFLVMAATLLDIKCKMLLPKQETEDGEEEIDPRAELVQKLLEYKMYKYMSMELKDMQMGTERYIYKKPSIPKEVQSYKPPIDYDTLVGDNTLQALNDLFKVIMKRNEEKIDPIRSGFGKIQREEVDLDKKQLEVCAYIESHKTCSFTDLLSEQKSKMDTIVTFLIVLELIKVGSIDVKQDSTFSDIEITYKAPFVRIELNG